jgi:hypothetical protein
MIEAKDAPLDKLPPYPDEVSPSGFINLSSYAKNYPTILSIRFYDGVVPIVVTKSGPAHDVKLTERPLFVLVPWILFGSPNFLV